MTQDKKLAVGDYVIVKGQRKGRYHLEGGVVVSIRQPSAHVHCDNTDKAIPLEMLEKFTGAYQTPRGNELVPFEGGQSCR